ncbi:GNAT family N-acetyltransferase [Streptococcus sp. S784/96/1]|uniref:GNAT family N-acetyltransferase n=1 Tax=Streptococcus sp. S784/96/1 TaxID=2653499 RepID=UPI0013898351|nr:GNAT family N-acetyltransferase [Streptococcus sp. S784/96/1]
MTDERVQQLSARFPKDVSEHYQQMIPAYQKGYADYVFQTDQEATQNRRIKQLTKTFRGYATKPYHYLQPLSAEDALQVATSWRLSPEKQDSLLNPKPNQSSFQVIKNGLFFAYCCVEEQNGTLVLAFAIAPQYRDNGHGRACYQAIEDYLKTSLTANRISLNLSPEEADNISFLESLGFQNVSNQDGYHLMTKPLVKE